MNIINLHIKVVFGTRLSQMLLCRLHNKFITTSIDVVKPTIGLTCTCMWNGKTHAI